MYRALSDPAHASRLWQARADGFKPEAGNSLAQTGSWIAAFAELGTIDREVSADAPFAACFSRDGMKTHVAWNVGREPRTVTFSDGVKVTCPPHGVARQ